MFAIFPCWIRYISWYLGRKLNKLKEIWKWKSASERSTIMFNTKHISSSFWNILINILLDKSEGKSAQSVIGKHCNKLIGHATLVIDVTKLIWDSCYNRLMCTFLIRICQLLGILARTSSHVLCCIKQSWNTCGNSWEDEEGEK